jgi:hypothetical protein
MGHIFSFISEVFADEGAPNIIPEEIVILSKAVRP